MFTKPLTANQISWLVKVMDELNAGTVIESIHLEAYCNTKRNQQNNNVSTILDFHSLLTNMREYEFSLTRIFDYTDRISNSVFIWDKYGSRKTRILAYFMQCGILKENIERRKKSLKKL